MTIDEKLGRMNMYPPEAPITLKCVCVNYGYWKVFPEKRGYIEGMGECKINPPVYGYTEGRGIHPAFPPTDREEWCGKFEEEK